MPNTDRYTRPQINAMLEKSDRAVERAIVRLFTMQNDDEQRWATTNTNNDRGFSACDAKAGTRFARWIQGMDNKNVKRYAAKSLTDGRAVGIFGRYCKGGEGVIDRARRIALKHSQQLVDYANENASIDVTKRVVSEEEENEAYWADAQQHHTGKKSRDNDCPTNEELAAEMAAESYGAAGGNQEEYYQQHLARLNKEDAEFMADWNKTGESKESRGPKPGTWAHTARMMAQGDDSGFDWDSWKDEMKDRDMR